MKIGQRDAHIRGRVVRIAHLDSDGIDSLDDVEGVVADIRKGTTRTDIFTFVQTLPQTQPQFDYPMEWDNVAALPISTFDHWWKKQIDFKVRNKARKGEKNGLAIREVVFDDALVRGISGIYNESPVRQGKRFWHYGKDLDTVRRENSTYPERSILIGAFLGDQLVGFLKLVIDSTRSQATVLQILSMLQHRDKAPTNALIAQGVKSCAERGIPYFVYANFSYGKKQRDTLSDFKQSNGFKRIEIPRYYIPLTPIGRAALHLGCHRRLAERIPEPLLVRFRDLRSRWNSKRFPVAKEAQ